MTAVGRIRLPAAQQAETFWEGRPAWRAVAVRVLHVRMVAGYFALLLALALVAGQWMGAVRLALAAAVVLGLMAAFAYATERTTRYVLTEHHLVMRFGLALPATLAIPLARIERVELSVRADHGGDVALTLDPAGRPGGRALGYLKLWPHARPWRLSPAQPMLRAIPRAAVPATLLARAVAAARLDARRISS
jgi:hypothetical protein